MSALPQAPLATRKLSPEAPIVFLHIPKTAGQTVHAELTRIAGADAVSPVRVHTQAEAGTGQFPPGFSVYSGHIDWDALDTLPANRFTFTVLRDPRERIASFYFYLLKEAAAQPPEELEKPHRKGMRRITRESAADYFFGGDGPWQSFVHDHYDNFYTRYFATRTMRGWNRIKTRPDEALLAEAVVGLRAHVDRVYSTLDLGALERDIQAVYGQKISVTDRFVNHGDKPRSEPRWPRLMALLDDPADRARLEGFVTRDLTLLTRLGLAV